MYDCFGIGFTDNKLILVTTVIYVLALGTPLAITYVAIGFKGHFKRQFNLVVVGFIVLLSGGFFFYNPKVSYIATAFIIINLGFSIHAVFTRHKIEPSL
jgi:hypothetical protein